MRAVNTVRVDSPPSPPRVIGSRLSFVCGRLPLIISQTVIGAGAGLLRSVQEIESQSDAEKVVQARLISEDFGTSKLGRLRTSLWNLTEYPETSLSARVSPF